MLENEKSKDEAREAFKRVPKAKPRKKKKRVRDQSVVKMYPYFTDLKACLESGWSPEMAYEYLEKRYGEQVKTPSAVSIRKWRDKYLPTATVVPHKFILEKLKGVDYKVDVLRNLSRLVPLMEERVARSLDQEENSFGGLPITITDSAVRTYLETLRSYVEVAQDLGLLEDHRQALIDARTQNVNNYSPEAMREFIEVATEMKKLGVPK